MYTRSKEAIYSVTTEFKNNYLWMSIEYGYAHPRPSHLIDGAKGNAFVENKRTDAQVEPSKQLFCVYIPERGTIYLSSTKQKLLISEILKSLSGEEYIIKRTYVDEAEFLRTLRRIERVEIAAKTDLITQSGDLFKPIQDIFGFAAPERFFLSADYGMPCTTRFLSQFKKFNSEYKKGTLQRFVCVGRDEEHIETVFNADTFTRKISLKAEKHENGLYDVDDVHNKIEAKLVELGVINVSRT